MAGRLALTGANGFVGRHLAALAAQQGWDVVGLVRSADGARVVQASGGRPLIVGEGDLAGDSLARALAGAAAVVHLAQIGSERGAATYEAVNVEGTRRVVAAAGKAGVPRVVLFSGLGVARYGRHSRVTNRYFLSKLAAELELFRSDREAFVFRPSYIVGPGDGLVPGLLREMAGGEVEIPGEGRYRMQPLFVGDAAAAALAVVKAPASTPGALPDRPPHRVVDLVGPEPVAYRDLVERVARLARKQGRPAEYRVREVAMEEADGQARAGGYHGLGPDALDCLLCDEVADPGPLQALLGRPLMPLAETLAAAIRGAPA